MPQAPGSQKQVFDYNLLRSVGRASAPGDKRYRQQQGTPWLAKVAFNLLGRQAMDYIGASKKMRREQVERNAIFDAELATTISEDAGMSDVVSESVQTFSDMRNEGQKLVKNYHGLPNHKKYKEGVALMNKAQIALKNLEQDLSLKLALKNKYISVEKDGVVIDEEGNSTPTEFAKYNHADSQYNTAMLMNGEIDKSFVVDENNGHLLLMKETRRGGFGPEGIVNATKIEYIPFSEIKFDKFKDATALHIESDARSTGSGYGEQGLDWDESMEMGIRADAKADIAKLSPAAFKSWFFSGTHYKYRDSGKNFMSPAEDFIAKKYEEIYQGMIDGDETATAEYEGIMDNLKQQDMEEGDEYKEFAIQSIVDVTKQYHAISKNVYDKENRSRGGGRGTQPQEKNKIVDGRSLGYEHSADIAAQMYSGASTLYSLDKDGKYKYVQDGKGYTEIFELEDQYNEDGYVTGEEYVSKGTMPTEQAVSKRGLDNIYNPPEAYTTATEEAKAESQEQSDDELLETLNTKGKTVVKTTDIMGKEVDSSGDLPKGIYVVTYDDGTTKRKVIK